MITRVINRKHMDQMWRILLSAAFVVGMLAAQGSIPAGAVPINPARFHAELVENDVVAMDWPADVDLTLTIDANPGVNPGADITMLGHTDAYGWVTFSGFAWIPPGETESQPLQLGAGMIVSVEGPGPVTKTHEIRYLYVNSVNHSLDTVSGIGIIGDQLNVQYMDEGGGTYRRWALVDEAYSWTVSFNTQAVPPDSGDYLDIYSGMAGEALWEDADGDVTDVQWRATAIGAKLTENLVEATGWAPGTELTIHIARPPSEYWSNAVVEAVPWGTRALFELDPYWTLAPGDEVFVGNAWFSRQLTVSALSVFDWDTDGDAIHGMAPGTDPVEVYAHCQQDPCEALRRVYAPEGGGIWVADFDPPAGTGEFGEADIEKGSGGQAYYHDYDGDHTMILWYLLNPRISARANDDHLEIWDYRIGTDVYVDVDAPVDVWPSPGTIGWDDPYTTMQADPENVLGSWGEFKFGEFDPDGDDIEPPFDLQPGMTVKVGFPVGGYVEKDLLVADIEIDDDSLEVGGSTFSGTLSAPEPPADPFEVQTNACDGSSCYNELATATWNGVNWDWTADFTGDWVFGAGDWVDSHLAESDVTADGDETAYGISLPMPNMSVRANEDRIEAYDFKMGETAELWIGDPSAPLYHTTQLIDTANPDGQTYVEFQLAPVPFDIQPGMLVTMSDGFTTKETTVTDVRITAYWLDAYPWYPNRVEVMAGSVPAAETEIYVNACQGAVCGGVVADLFSSPDWWRANLSGLWQIQWGDWLDSHQADEDGDETAFGIHLNARLDARPNEDAVEFINVPMGWDMQLTIVRAGHYNHVWHETVTEYTPWGSGETYLRLENLTVDGEPAPRPGDVIILSDEGGWKSHTVTALTMTGFDLDTNVVHGFAAYPSQGIEVRACDDVDCAELYALADSTGNWAVDFTGTRDLEPGMWLDSRQYDADPDDEDNDATASGLQIPADVTLTFRSVGTQDGWILESGENSDAGGSMESAATTFMLGDDASNRQYRGLLSFNTASLPDNAIITAASLNFRKTGMMGANPFATLGNIIVDVKNGSFSNNTALQLGDFRVAGSKNYVRQYPDSTLNGWFSRALISNCFGYINRLGETQFRLRFDLDDNNNFAANYLRIASGNAIMTSRPQLIITYHLP